MLTFLKTRILRELEQYERLRPWILKMRTKQASTESDWETPESTLGEKWTDVPEFTDSRDILDCEPTRAAEIWEQTREEAVIERFNKRGWYHELYRDFVAGKKIVDVGCGFGIDGISFLKYGANEVTFADVTAENLETIELICEGIDASDRVKFYEISTVDDLEGLGTDFDVVWAQGSLHHAPQEIIEPEIQELLQRLKIGGRWIQLAYPFERWERDGRLDYSQWGEVTDGPGTPWAEPYDLEKLLEMMKPAELDPVLDFNWRDDEFNWFDLKLRSR